MRNITSESRSSLESLVVTIHAKCQEHAGLITCVAIAATVTGGVIALNWMFIIGFALFVYSLHVSYMARLAEVVASTLARVTAALPGGGSRRLRALVSKATL